MKQNRTGKVLNTSFRNTNYEGHISKSIPIHSFPQNYNIKLDGELRREVQETIRDKIEQRESLEKIREFLNQERYKEYEQYTNSWVETWIIKLNPDIKYIIDKGLDKNKTKEELIQEIKEVNSLVYELYKELIEEKVQSEIKQRKRQKQEREQKEEER